MRRFTESGKGPSGAYLLVSSGLQLGLGIDHGVEDGRVLGHEVAVRLGEGLRLDGVEGTKLARPRQSRRHEQTILARQLLIAIHADCVLVCRTTLHAGGNESPRMPRSLFAYAAFPQRLAHHVAVGINLCVCHGRTGGPEREVGAPSAEAGWRLAGHGSTYGGLGRGSIRSCIC